MKRLVEGLGRRTALSTAGGADKQTVVASMKERAVDSSPFIAQNGRHQDPRHAIRQRITVSVSKLNYIEADYKVVVHPIATNWTEHSFTVIGYTVRASIHRTLCAASTSMC